MGELPDELRVPLHSLQADIRMLFGRVAADGSVAGMMADSVLDRLSQIETACYLSMLPNLGRAIVALRKRDAFDAALTPPTPSAESEGAKLAEEFEAFVTSDDEYGDQEFGRFCQERHARILAALKIAALRRSPSQPDEALAKAREALEPFAAIAGRYPKLEDHYPLWAARLSNSERVSNQDMSQINHEPVVTVGDLRRARAALDALRKAGEAP